MRKLIYKVLAWYYFWRASSIHLEMVKVHGELQAITRANEMVGRYVRMDRQLHLEGKYAELDVRYKNAMAMYTAFNPNKAANIVYKVNK